MTKVVVKHADGSTTVREVSAMQFQPTGRTLTVDERRQATSPRPVERREEVISFGCGMVCSAQHYHPRVRMR